MKKLKLSLELLCVDSFQTAGEQQGRGTVQGHDGTRYADTCGCGPRPSDGCSIGCPATFTCDGTEGPGCANNPYTVIVW